MGTSEFSRRSLFKLSAVAASAGVGGWALSGCGAADGTTEGQGKKEVVFATTGGSWSDTVKQEWGDPLAAQFGVNLVLTGPPDNGKITAMVQAKSVIWDVADCSPDFPLRPTASDVLEPIDWGRLGSVAGQLTDISSIPGSGGGTLKLDYAVPQLLGSRLITYRKDAYSGSGPQSWAEVWDVKKFPGKRAFGTAVIYGTLEAALLADGVARDKIYPIDIDRALRKFDEIKEHIVWFDSGAQQAQIFADKTATAGLGWGGRMAVLKSQGVPIETPINESVLALNTMAIPKGAPHVDEAYKFFEVALGAKTQASIAQKLNNGPVNSAAFDLLNTADRARLDGNPDQLKVCLWQNFQWWAANQEEAQRRFDAWRLG